MNRLGWQLALIGALALVLRAGWVGYRWWHGGPAFDYPDEDLHWQLATHLVREGVLVSDDGRSAARMPLYPLFLALFAWAGPLGILAARLGQVALGVLSVAVVHRWVGAALGPRAALIAGLLVCCDPFAVFFTNLLLTETLFGLVLVALVACAWSAWNRPRWAIPAVAWLGAVAVLVRPSVAGLLPVLWAVMVLGATDRARVVVRLWLCPVVLAAALLPWGLRNRAVLGACAWLSTNGGATLYDAQGPHADGSSNQAFLPGLPALRDADEVTRDRLLTHLAIKQMRQDPGRVLALAGRKFVRTWSPIPNVAEYRAGPAAWAGAAYTIVLVVGALAGLALALRWRASAGPQVRRIHALLWLPVVYFTLVHCVYVGSVRYRLPLMPLLAVAAGAASGSSGRLSTPDDFPILRQPGGADATGPPLP